MRLRLGLVCGLMVMAFSMISGVDGSVKKLHERNPSSLSPELIDNEKKLGSCFEKENKKKGVSNEKPSDSGRIDQALLLSFPW